MRRRVGRWQARGRDSGRDRFSRRSRRGGRRPIAGATPVRRRRRVLGAGARCGCRRRRGRDRGRRHRRLRNCSRGIRRRRRRRGWCRSGRRQRWRRTPIVGDVRDRRCRRRRRRRAPCQSRRDEPCGPDQQQPSGNRRQTSGTANPAARSIDVTCRLDVCHGDFVRGVANEHGVRERRRRRGFVGEKIKRIFARRLPRRTGRQLTLFREKRQPVCGLALGRRLRYACRAAHRYRPKE